MMISSKDPDDPLFDYQNFINETILDPLSVEYKGIFLASIPLQELVLRTILHIDQKSQKKEYQLSYVLFFDTLSFFCLPKRSKKTSLFKGSFMNLSVAKGIFLPFPKSIILKENIHHISPVSYVLNLLHLAQEKKFNVFFIGNNISQGKLFIQNIKRSFPNLNIIGSYNYKKSISTSILESFRKTNPSIVLLSLDSFSAERDWLLENKHIKSSSVVISLNHYLCDFLKTPTGLSSYFHNGYLYWYWRATINPLHWYKWLFFLIWFIKSYIYQLIYFLKNLK